jgi:hypothetical protein
MGRPGKEPWKSVRAAVAASLLLAGAAAAQEPRASEELKGAEGEYAALRAANFEVMAANCERLGFGAPLHKEALGKTADLDELGASELFDACVLKQEIELKIVGHCAGQARATQAPAAPAQEPETSVDDATACRKRAWERLMPVVPTLSERAPE